MIEKGTIFIGYLGNLILFLLFNRKLDIFSIIYAYDLDFVIDLDLHILHVYLFYFKIV